MLLGCVCGCSVGVTIPSQALRLSYPVWVTAKALSTAVALMCARRQPKPGAELCGAHGAQNYQVDWEAILSRSREPFIASVSAWLYPPAARAARGTANGLEAEAVLNVSALPPVREVLATSRQRIEALNGPGMARI